MNFAKCQLFTLDFKLGAGYGCDEFQVGEKVALEVQEGDGGGGSFDGPLEGDGPFSGLSAGLAILSHERFKRFLKGDIYQRRWWKVEAFEVANLMAGREFGVGRPMVAVVQRASRVRTWMGAGVPGTGRGVVLSTFQGLPDGEGDQSEKNQGNKNKPDWLAMVV